MTADFIVRVQIKNDQLTRDAGQDIQEILIDSIMKGMRDTIQLPWVLGVEIMGIEVTDAPGY